MDFLLESLYCKKSKVTHCIFRVYYQAGFPGGGLSEATCTWCETRGKQTLSLHHVDREHCYLEQAPSNTLSTFSTSSLICLWVHFFVKGDSLFLYTVTHTQIFSCLFWDLWKQYSLCTRTSALVRKIKHTQDVRGEPQERGWVAWSQGFAFEKINSGDFPGGPVVNNPPCSAGDLGLIPERGAKIPHATRLLSPCTTTKTRHSQINKKTFLKS